MKLINKLFFNTKFGILLTVILFVLSNNGIIFASTVVGEGEAVIKDNDIKTAKSMALIRAKWAAVEGESAANVKVDTIINNSKIIDEAIKTELSATVSSYKVIEEKVAGDKYYVKIEATVIDKVKDEKVASGNKQICVLIAGVIPDNRVDFNNSYTLKTISLLNENGFDVVEVDYNKINTKDFLAAIKNNDKTILANMLKNYKCQNILLGSLFILDKGSNTGYGKFNIQMVSAELTWKLLDNDLKVIKGDTLSGRGQGVSMDDAATRAYKNISETGTMQMVSQVSESLLDSDKKYIRVVLTGSNTNIDDLNELRNELKHIPFVLGVKELNNTSLAVNYPEKALYLGMFLERENKYRVVKLNDNELIIRK